MLAGPARALAQSIEEQFDQAFGTAPAPLADVPPPVPALPTEVVPNPAYDRKVLEIAARERDRAGAALWRRDIVGVADFARPSTLPRLHFANLEDGTMRSFYVTHGRGSDREHDGWLKQFSNVIHPDAPVGGEDDFVVLEHVGTPRDFAAEGITVQDIMKTNRIKSVKDLKPGTTLKIVMDA